MANFRNIDTFLMLAIAGSTNKELDRLVRYLRAENQILRSRLLDRESLSDREKAQLRGRLFGGSVAAWASHCAALCGVAVGLVSGTGRAPQEPQGNGPDDD